MSIRVNAHMTKIMRTPIKLGVRTCATYANCQTLLRNWFIGFPYINLDYSQNTLQKTKTISRDV